MEHQQHQSEKGVFLCFIHKGKLEKMNGKIRRITQGTAERVEGNLSFFIKHPRIFYRFFPEKALQ